MTTQAYPYLVLTDGTTTITIADGAGGQANYSPSTAEGSRDVWAPAIPALRASLLGGYGSYSDVVETIQLRIVDTTAAGALAKLDALARLIDQADRWWRRFEPVAPVTIRYVPQGSTVHSSAGTMLQAIVLGRGNDDQTSGVQLPVTFNDVGMVYEVRGLTLQILRRGVWTGANEVPAASGSSANPTVMNCTFAADHPVSSPMDVSIGGFDKTATPTITAGYLIVGSRSSDIQIVEAEGATAAKYTSVNDAAHYARSNNVLRYTPTDTSAATSGTLTLGTGISGPVAIIAAVRNNGASTYTLQASLGGLGTTPASTPAQLIDASSANPQLVLLGTLLAGSPTTTANKLSLTAQASAASGSLDIDYLIVVNMLDETVGVIAHDAVSLANLSAGAASLDVVWRPTVDRQPVMQVSGVGGNIPMTYRGAIPLLSKGTKAYVVWTAPNGANWRFTNATPAVLSVNVQVGRYQSYVSPL